jgi:hypothetical protein
MMLEGKVSCLWWKDIDFVERAWTPRTETRSCVLPVGPSSLALPEWERSVEPGLVRRIQALYTVYERLVCAIPKVA